MNQSQLAELFATPKQNISLHVNNIIKDKELNAVSVVKDYLTTETDGKANQQSPRISPYFKHCKQGMLQRMFV